MPPDGDGITDLGLFARIAGTVYGILAIVYAIFWAYGHFRWGWGL